MFRCLTRVLNAPLHFNYHFLILIQKDFRTISYEVNHKINIKIYNLIFKKNFSVDVPLLLLVVAITARGISRTQSNIYDRAFL